MKIVILKKRKITLLLGILVLLLVLFSAHERVMTVVVKNFKPIYAVKTETKQIAITFDISWGEKNVIPILDILKAENVKATFFLSSPWAEDNPELVRRIIEDGHEVGSHSRRHVDLNTLSETELINELNASKKVLENLTGKNISLLRPPNGAYNNKVILIANDLGYKVIQWSIDSLDWKKPGVDAVINNIINGRHKNDGATPGDILLFHASDSAPDTPKALPTIIQILKSKNYELVTVSTLLNDAEEFWPPESNF